MRTRSYRDLEVWRKAMELVAAVNKVASLLPGHERYGLASQLRRASVSVPANIAEGNRRWHRREYVQHVSIARASLAELETHLEIARICSYVSEADLDNACRLSEQVGRMLTRLFVRLRETEKD